jgi:AcrR family transcriptional regulator
MVYRQTPRTERARAERRARILRAARRLFLRRGYQVTTMRDVAAAAGTSIGNLYFYFEDKEALLETLLAETREPTWARADALSDALPAGPARLAVLLYANTVTLLGPTRDLTRAMLLLGAPPQVVERALEAYRVRLRGYLRDNVPGLPDRDGELAVTAWTGANRSLVERRVRDELDTGPMDLAMFTVRWNLRAVGFSDAEITEAIEVATRLVDVELAVPAS